MDLSFLKKDSPRFEESPWFSRCRIYLHADSSREQKVITENCQAKIRKINICSQASKRLFCLQNKRMHSLKHVPRQVKEHPKNLDKPKFIRKAFKSLLSTLLCRKTSGDEDFSAWLPVEIHLISRTKCLCKTVNTVSCKDFEICQTRRNISLSTLTNVISKNCACSDKINLKINTSERQSDSELQNCKMI